MYRPLLTPYTKISVNLPTRDLRLLRAHAETQGLTGVGELVRAIIAEWCAGQHRRKQKPKPPSPSHSQFFVEDPDDHD